MLQDRTLDRIPISFNLLAQNSKENRLYMCCAEGSSSCKRMGLYPNVYWLVVSAPLKTMKVSWDYILFPKYGNVKNMFQSTNQYISQLIQIVSAAVPINNPNYNQRCCRIFVQHPTRSPSGGPRGRRKSCPALKAENALVGMHCIPML